MWGYWGQHSINKVTSALLCWIWESLFRFFSNYEYLTNEHPCSQIHIWRLAPSPPVPWVLPGTPEGEGEVSYDGAATCWLKRLTAIYPQTIFSRAWTSSSVQWLYSINIHWAYARARHCDNYSGTDLSPSTFRLLFTLCHSVSLMSCNCFLGNRLILFYPPYPQLLSQFLFGFLRNSYFPLSLLGSICAPTVARTATWSETVVLLYIAPRKRKSYIQNFFSMNF